MPTPTDAGLYEEAKDFIMSKYKKNSPYASGAVVKHYKGLFKKKIRRRHTSLQRRRRKEIRKIL